MTTSLTESQTNHMNDSNLTVTEEERTKNQTVSLMSNDEERNNDEEHKSSDQLPNGTEEMKHQTILMQTSPSIVTNGDETKEQYETTTSSFLVNHDDDEYRAKKSFESKTKFNPSTSYRPGYYSNGLQYGSMQYYYYPQTNSVDKPTPLMFIPTPSPLGSGTAQTSSQVSSTVSSSSRENQTGNSTTNSPPNLPPRLRQTSTTENENHSNATTGASNNNTTTNTTSTTQSSTSHPTTNGRRNRSIFPRGYPSFYAQHPPPPLMATPPGVLYPYPPVVHPAGPIAYNIRSTEDLEYFAYPQQFVPLPPAPLLWTSTSQTGLPTAGPAPYPGYPMADLSTGYIYNNTAMIPPTMTSLNPEAAEWVPTFQENSSESSETPIQLDDEVSFPPLNGSVGHTVPSSVNHNAKDTRNEDINESSTEVPLENSVTKNDTEESTEVSEPSTTTSVPTENKVETVTVPTSSQEQTTNSSLTKPTVVTAPTKATPVPYSTVISQTSDNQKSTKTNHQSATVAARRAQQAVKDRSSKPVQPVRGNPPVAPAPVVPASQTNNQRRQPVKTNTNGSRNLPSPQFNAPPKQQQQQQIPPSPTVSDEWIEVKSKKTKKFDRFTAENSSEKISIEEPIHQTISPDRKSVV